MNNSRDDVFTRITWIPPTSLGRCFWCRERFTGKCLELRITTRIHGGLQYLCEPCGLPYVRELSRAVESRRGL